MFFKLHKFARLPAIAILCIAPSFVCFAIGQNSVQNSAIPATETETYFPAGAADGFSDYFSGYLRSVGEPSLLSAAQDHGVVSYRLEWLSGQRGYVLAVRLSLNPDGTGTIAATKHPAAPATATKIQRDISRADVQKFLQAVEAAGFWSMPTDEQPVNGRKYYKLDASICVVEGVSNGSYHVVFRRGPEAGPFADMILFLASDLAGIDRLSGWPAPSKAPKQTP